MEFEPAFDLDYALQQARQMTGRDDGGAPYVMDDIKRKSHEQDFYPRRQDHPFRRWRRPSSRRHWRPGTTSRTCAITRNSSRTARCKLCTVKVNGRQTASCTMPAAEGMVVESDTAELNAERRALLQMLFVEGNHFCPSCEKSGNCQLQATAYELDMMTPHYDHFYPDRPVDASHPDMLLDFNRCILCELCVRASRDVDGKNVFALARARHQIASDRQRRVRQAGATPTSPPPTRRPMCARSA